MNLLIVLFFTISAQQFTKQIVLALLKRGRDNTENLINKLELKSLKYINLDNKKVAIPKDTIELINSELTKHEIALKFKNSTHFVTSIIGIIEILAFAAIFMAEPSLIGIRQLLMIAGGWIGIKAIGNYQQWSGIIFGRCNSQIFIIGSLVNVIWGILLGYLILYLRLF